MPDIGGDPQAEGAVTEQRRDVYPPGGAEGVHPGEVGRPGQVDHTSDGSAEPGSGDHDGRTAHGRAHQNDLPGTVIARPLRRGADLTRVDPVPRHTTPLPVESKTHHSD